VRRLLGPRLFHRLVDAADIVRTRGPVFFVRWNVTLTDAWIRDRVRRRSYPLLSEQQLRAARRSETVFVFGSGSSLNDISADEWAHFREHDVFGFNLFYHQQWVPVDFHLVRGGVYGEPRWRPYAEQTVADIRANPLYERTIFLLQDDYFGQFANQLVGYGLLPHGGGLFRYRTAAGWGPPGRSFADGIRHIGGTLTDAVNCAYCLGWRRIVLVGVDLYDSRYFFLPPDRTLTQDPERPWLIVPDERALRGQRYDELHNTVQSGVVELLGEWSAQLEREDVRLEVYNPRSLLADVMPVYRAPAPR
jgi:hypothetical protein